MRMVIQRVAQAAVEVDGAVIGQIGRGLLVFLGICPEDDEAAADQMVKKLLGLRIFKDAQGKTNLSLQDVEGELMIVSQFTLYADCRKGNRPSFVQAAGPDQANALYEYIIRKAAQQVPRVAHGRFGADMKVNLQNDGPFTIVLDTADFKRK